MNDLVVHGDGRRLSLAAARALLRRHVSQKNVGIKEEDFEFVLAHRFDREGMPVGVRTSCSGVS